MAGFSKIINKISLIKHIPIFSRLSWLELHTIAQRTDLLEFKKGDLICKEGSPSDGFYCLISGRVQSFNYSFGKKENIEYILRGMHFGIISLFTGETHSHSYETLNDSLILKIPKDDFEHILKMIPRLGIDFSQSLSQKLRSTNTNTKASYESMIISIYSPVKGAGSSTYAFNLALNLQKETQRKVIYVSITSTRVIPQVSASPIMEASPTWKREPVHLKEMIDDYKKVKQYIATGELSFDLMHVIFDAEDETTISQISHFVSELANHYYYVIVDLPNDMNDVVLQTLTQSDIVHLVTMSRKEDLRLTREVIEHLQKRYREKPILEKVQVIVSDLDPKYFLTHEEVNKILNYNIFTNLPVITRPELQHAIISEEITAIVPDEFSEYARSVKRIARKIGGVLVGVVLGGGAALGVAHIGIIRVLERENIPVDMVVGSSMGALIASLWATGMNADTLEAVAREFKSKSSTLKLFDPVLPRGGFIGGRSIKFWLKRHLGEKTFYDTKIPLKIISYDLIHREEHVIEEGSLVDAVRESIAIPGVINPVLKKDQMIIDGGVMNPLPTNVLRDFGIQKIIAINVLQSPSDVSKGHEIEQKELEKKRKLSFFKSPLDYLGVRLAKLLYPNIPDIIIRTLQASEYVIAEQSAKLADIVIHPDLTGINWFELYEVDRLIKSGEEAAQKALPQIKALVTLNNRRVL